jgi:hypothetical protein
MANRTTKQKRNNLITGNTGMYFVAYQLSRRGWNVMPTSRNAQCFVLTPGEAKRGAVQDEGAPQAFWLPWHYYSKERFRKWDRIGRGDDPVRNSVRVSGGE